ncbi:hypothetical protein GCK72_007326 [Caenorhabditis remanei]|uniref:F-box domain-containing protein n=1 Tax=Caenorhabditis remanei TaxID=31234 RepID=A0A6A5HLM6_CAERE|nr:hypothetical protein GCK72_007326 [Caenorhabditis remanei]KAF1767367.1 hypothetical protein GCK72_007326 [Caenorhabditis remanei]
MPDELSYPGLKCVLEFLEANKRIHVSSRCPRLKHIERCVPLYLNTLYFRTGVVKLNDITYAIVERKEQTTVSPHSELKYGDLLIGNPVYIRYYPAIRFSKQESLLFSPYESVFVERRVQEKEGVQNYEIIRESIQGLMGGRKDVRVYHLLFEHCNSSILRLPSDFKVRIRKLYSGYINPKYFLPLIDSSSFPLKEIYLSLPVQLDQSIVQSSEKLVISVNEEYSRNHLDDIFNLPNQCVILEFLSLSEDGYSHIIDYWLDNKRETIKCFMIKGSKTESMEAAIDLMKKYNGKMVKWNGTEFRSNSNTNYISIPFNDDFVIGIYAVSHRERRISDHQIVMKTMPINSFIPAEEFSNDKTLIEIEHLERKRED